MDIEEEYTSLLKSLTPLEKVKRSMAMFKMVRDAIGRQIIHEKGEIPLAQLKLEVALRMYADEPIAVLIKEELARVSS